MSLSKQLLLLISILFVLIFVGNLAISIKEIRDYLRIESLNHAQNTATSLGLSLTPHISAPSDPIIQTMIQAIHDMGDYGEIRLSDVAGRTLAVANAKQALPEVPDWFMRWLPIQSATATSEISAGWQIVAVVEVSVDPRRAYLNLYRQLRESFWYSLAALSLSMLALLLMLRLTLHPLKSMERLAVGIAEGRFARIEPLPWTTEVKNVATAMNRMSDQIETVIVRLTQKAETLGEELQRDHATGLYGAERLASDLEHWLTHGQGGFAVWLRIQDLGALATRLGPAGTDRFLRDLAARLSDAARDRHREARAYRHQGPDLALLLPGLDASEAESFTHALVEHIVEVGRAVEQYDLVHLGLAPFNASSTPEGVLAAAADACAQACLIGPNAWVIRQSPEPGRSDAEWRALIERILDSQDYQVAYIDPVQDLLAPGILMEEAFLHIADTHGEPIPTGVFVSMAEKIGRIESLDRGVIKRALTHLRSDSSRPTVLVNLSMVTLGDADFRHWLAQQLQDQQTLAKRLLFGVSAYSAAKAPSLVWELADVVHRHGAGILIKRYEPRFIPIETLRELRPDAIRLARDLTAGIRHDHGKQAMVEALLELGALLDIQVIAERVEEETDLMRLREMGLSGASR